MINGQIYNVKIVAVYANGEESLPSLVSSSSPGTASAPSKLTVAAGNQKLIVSFTSGEFDGGFGVTNYSYDIWPSTEVTHIENWQLLSPQKNASPITITGLTNGTAYKFKIRPVNATGLGEISPEASGTPKAEVPEAPVISSVSAGNASLTVNFSPPSSDGGRPVTGYKYSVNGGATKLDYLSLESPLDVDNLTNGTAYAVLLYAVNAVGISPASNSIEATPTQGTTPTAPKITNVTSGVRQLTVHFNPPENDNGHPVERYQYKLNSGRWITRTPETTITSPLVISKLASFTSYKLRLRAVNSSGAGAASAVVLGTTLKTAPDAPRIAGLSMLGFSEYSISISFYPPEDNGGSAITAFEFSVSARWEDGNYVDRTIAIADVNKNTSTYYVLLRDLDDSNIGKYPAPGSFDFIYYTERVQIRAVNSVGAGLWSEGVGYTTDPAGLPLPAPTEVNATPLSSTSISITFIPPAVLYPESITGYQYSLNAGADYSSIVQAVDDTIIVDGLEPGRAYEVKIKGVNGQDFAASSEIVLVTTLPEAPTAPTIYAITGLNQQLIVQFSPPVIPGGVILDYEYSLDSGSYASGGVRNSPIIITGTLNDVLYDVTVRAVNQVGVGAVSNVAIGLSGKPTAPTIDLVKAVPGAGGMGRTLQLYFTPPSSDGGSPITKYHYSTDNGVSFKSVPNTSTYYAKVSPITIQELNNSETYQVVLKAENMLGLGLLSPATPGTPFRYPDAPTITQVVVDSSKLGTITIHFTPTTYDGGSAVTGYEYTVDAGSLWLTAAVTPGNTIITNTATKFSTTAIVALRAVNAAGPGQQSNRVTAFPVTVPAHLTEVSLTQGSLNPLQITLNITPGSTGGSPITHYRYALIKNGAATAFRYLDYPGSSSTPHTFILPDTFNYGDRLYVKAHAINFGAAISEQSPSPITAASGVNQSPDGSSNTYSLHVSNPNSLISPSKLGSYILHWYEPTTNKLKVSIENLKIPINPINTYIGSNISNMQSLASKVLYSIDGGVTYKELWNLFSNTEALRTSKDLQSGEAYCTIPGKLYIEGLFGNVQYTILLVCANNYIRSSPATSFDAGYFLPPPALISAPPPDVPKPPAYTGISIINISTRTFTYLSEHVVAVEFVTNLEDDYIYLLLAKGGVQQPVTSHLQLDTKFAMLHKASYPGQLTVFNYIQSISFISDLLPSQPIPNQQTGYLGGDVSLPYEQAPLPGGKRHITIYVWIPPADVDVTLTLTASNSRTNINHDGLTINLPNTDSATDIPPALNFVWWPGAYTKKLPLLGSSNPNLYRYNEDSYLVINTDCGYVYKYALNIPYKPTPPDSYHYVISVYRVPENTFVAWRFRGEGPWMWRLIHKPIESPDYFLTYRSLSGVDVLKTPRYADISPLDVNFNYARNWINYRSSPVISGCGPFNPMMRVQQASNYPEIWIHDSIMMDDQNNPGKQKIHINIKKSTFDLCKQSENAESFREIEFITCTGFGGELGLPKGLVGTIVPYFFNLVDSTPEETRYYSGIPMSSGLASFETPITEYTWEPVPGQRLWTPEPYRLPTEAETLAIKARFPEWFDRPQEPS